MKGKKIWFAVLVLLALMALACGGTKGSNCKDPGSHRYENKGGHSQKFVCVKNRDGSSTWQ